MKKVRLEKLHVKNFRGIKDLSFEGFGGVNVLLGQNNVGKTSILEAIVLSAHPFSVVVGTRRGRYVRELDPRSAYEDFTFLGAAEKGKDLSLWSTFSNGEKRTMGLSLEESLNTDDREKPHLSKRLEELKKNPRYDVLGSFLTQSLSVEKTKKNIQNYYNFLIPGPYRPRKVFSRLRRSFYYDRDCEPANGLGLDIDDGLRGSGFSSFLAEIVNKREERGDYDDLERGKFLSSKKIRSEFVKCLKVFDKDILDVRFGEGNGPVSVEFERFDSPLPISSMGNGFIFTFQILFNFFSMYSARENPEAVLFLIDEIENGLHYSRMEEVIGFLLNLSRELGIQLFIATHSVDVLKAFRRVLLKEEYARFRDELNVFTLEAEGSKIYQNHFGYDTLEDCIGKDIEVRG